MKKFLAFLFTWLVPPIMLFVISFFVSLFHYPLINIPYIGLLAEIAVFGVSVIVVCSFLPLIFERFDGCSKVIRYSSTFFLVTNSIQSLLNIYNFFNKLALDELTIFYSCALVAIYYFIRKTSFYFDSNE